MNPKVPQCIRNCLAAFTVLLFGWLSSPVDAAEAPGRDLAVLVDVSKSMYVTEEGRQGSDRDRLRWDAVKLVLDFLTDDDRILIVPFNDQSPAVVVDPNKQTKSVPGRLAPGLRWLGAAGERQALEQKIFSFIHNKGLESVDQAAAEFNTDLGGTSIVRALGYAKSQLEQGRAANRMAAVVLLTDGKETGEAPLVQSGQWRSDPRVTFFVTSGIPVYTIGLGTEPDRAFLGALSSMTSGSFFPARTNQELIQIFRNLIWSLNRSWIRQVTDEELKGRNDPGIRSRPLEGIIDLGVLSYVVDRARLGAGNPRVTLPPAPLPATQWIGLGANVRPVQLVRTGKPLEAPQSGGSGYAFHYYDGRTASDDRPRALFNRRGRVELELKFKKGAEDLSVFIVKRAPPLFDVDLPANSFYRHQPIPVRVVMQESPIFNPDQFEVSATLYPADDIQKARGVSLANKAPTRDFEVEGEPLTAAELPSGGGDTDNYTLKISISGKPDLDHALSGFSTELPPRTIEIRNVVPLKLTGDAPILDRKTPRREVQVESLYPMKGELPLNIALVSPAAQGEKAGLPARHFELSAGDKPLEDEPLLLKDGKATLTLAFGKELPAGGVVYGPGRLSLTPSSRDRHLKITDGAKPDSSNRFDVPFQIRIDTIGIHISEKAFALESVADRPQPSAGFKVELTKADDSTTGAGKLAVELLPPAAEGKDEAKSSYLAEELWIQPAGPPLAPQARKQRIELSQPGEDLQLYFSPRPRGNDVQALRPQVWQLAASGKGFDTARSPVTVSIAPPQVALKQVEPLEIYTYPGAPPVEVSLEARLVWLPGGKWSFALQPEDGRILFQRKPDVDRKEPATLPVEFDAPAGPVVLDVPAERTATNTGWRAIPIRLKIPAKLPAEAGYGTYRGVLSLVHNGETYASLRIDLSINSLGIRVSPDRLALRSGAEQPRSSLPVTVELTSPKASTKGATNLTLGIERAPGADNNFTFSPEELWIQPEGPDLPADKRKQSLVLQKPGQPLRVVFQPTPRRAAGLLGDHLYRLVAKGQGYDDAQGTCALAVEKPELILQHERPLKFQVPAGEEPLRVDFQAQLRWLPGGSYSFTPRPSEPTLTFVPEDRAPSDNRPGLQVGISGLPETLMLQTPQKPVDAAASWEKFSFVLSVPQNLSEGGHAGVYRGAVEFVDGEEVYGRIPVILELNALYLQDASAKDDAQRMAELKVVQFFDRPAAVTLRLRNEMDQPLDPAKLKRDWGAPGSKEPQFLTGGRGDVLPRPVIAKDGVRRDSDGRGLLIDLQFPPVVNADPTAPYKVDVTFSYHDPDRKIDLHGKQLRINVFVVDPRQVLLRQK